MIARSSKIIGRRLEWKQRSRDAYLAPAARAGDLSSALPRRHSSVQKQDIPVVRRIAANS